MADESPAKAAGLAIGDVITSVGGEKVKSVLELRREVRKHPDEKVALSLMRKGTTKARPSTPSAKSEMRAPFPFSGRWLRRATR